MEQVADLVNQIQLSSPTKDKKTFWSLVIHVKAAGGREAGGGGLNPVVCSCRDVA